MSCAVEYPFELVVEQLDVDYLRVSIPAATNLITEVIDRLGTVTSLPHGLESE